MSVILVFIAFVIAGQTANVLLASLVERFSETAGLFVFLAIFIAVMVGAWHAAVYVTERYIVRQN
jgi:hypothetical protein